MEAIDMVLNLWQQSVTAHNDNVSAEGFQQCDLYVTCEPCIMCAAALSLLGTYLCGEKPWIQASICQPFFHVVLCIQGLLYGLKIMTLELLV